MFKATVKDVQSAVTLLQANYGAFLSFEGKLNDCFNEFELMAADHGTHLGSGSFAQVYGDNGYAFRISRRAPTTPDGYDTFVEVIQEMNSVEQEFLPKIEGRIVVKPNLEVRDHGYEMVITVMPQYISEMSRLRRLTGYEQEYAQIRNMMCGLIATHAFLQACHRSPSYHDALENAIKDMKEDYESPLISYVVSDNACLFLTSYNLAINLYKKHQERDLGNMRMDVRTPNMLYCTDTFTTIINDAYA